MANQPRVLHFHTDAIPDDTFDVSTFDGANTISSLYRFDVDLVSKKPDIDFTSILNSPAWLGIKAPVRLRDGGSASRVLKIHGMVSSIRQFDRVDEWSRYQLTLVPRLWHLSTDVMTRIFIDKSVPEMIEEILKEEGFSARDYEFRCAKGRKREFAIQYQESDFDFFSRWLEHEGIFYFFEQSDDCEKIVFADSTAGYVPLLGGAHVVSYRPIPGAGDFVAAEDGSDWFRDEVIQSFTADQQVIPKKVILKDYNWRKPSQDLKVDSDVVPEGMGTVYYYADHYKDTAEGKILAKTRSEEFKCRQKLYSGSSNHMGFCAGATFELDGHYRRDFNQEYVITSVHHHGEQALGLVWSGVKGTLYRNEFVSIPEVEIFRPERKTRWPSIHGIMHAKIDSGGDGKYAEIDDMGRYKVLLPFDLSGRSNGQASRFVRMAQPYAGGGMGMHFPLHKGTEVLLAFLDGDPDRPIIIGAVPNPETGSPVTGGNQTQCAIHTGGGNKFVIEDTAGNERIKMTTPRSATFLQLGSPNEDGDGMTAGTAQDITFASGRDYIRRTGGKVLIDIAKNEHKITRGDSSSETVGNTRSYMRGNAYSETVGDSESKVNGSSTSTAVGASHSRYLSGQTEYGASLKHSTTAGASISQSLSFASSLVAGASHDTYLGAKISANKGVTMTVCDLTTKETSTQKLVKVAAEHKNDCGSYAVDAMSTIELKANTSVKLIVGGSEISVTGSEIQLKVGGTCIKLNGSAVQVNATSIAMANASQIQISAGSIKEV